MRQRAYELPAFAGPIDLRLDGNEGPQPPASLVAACAAEPIQRYPDARPLEARLAAQLGIASARVLVTAGADDGLDRFCRAFLGPGKRILVPSPTFEMLTRYAGQAGAEVVEVSWEGRFPTDALLAAGPAAAIAVVSPNNPTGAVATREDLRALAGAGVPLLVDCAYAEFADEDLTSLALDLPNAVVFRTFSKAWGLAGLRVGWAAGSEASIAALRAVGAPYAVSRLSLAVAERWLDQGRPSVESFVARVRNERAALTALLRSLGADVGESQGNFVLARVPDAAFLRDALAGLGIAVRCWPDRAGLENAVRIALPGDPGRFARLCAGLEAALAPQALLLDLDGVLADVSGSFRVCIVETAATYGVAITREEIAACKAEGDANNDWIVTWRLLQRRGIACALDEVIERFQAIYQGTDEAPGLRRVERPIGDRGALERLARRLPIAIVTGRPRRDAMRFLGDFGMLPFVRGLVCMEDAPRKPDPAPVRLAMRQLGVERAWMVGDTPDDVLAARRAGVVPFGVEAPGDASRDVLLAAGAARVPPSLDELERWLP